MSNDNPFGGDYSPLIKETSSPTVRQFKGVKANKRNASKVRSIKRHKRVSSKTRR